MKNENERPAELSPAELIECILNRMLMSVVNDDANSFTRVSDTVTAELNRDHTNISTNDLLSHIDFRMLEIPTVETPIELAIETRITALNHMARLGWFEE